MRVSTLLSAFSRRKGCSNPAEIEAYIPDAEANDQRTAWQDAFVQRVLRVVFEEAERLKQGGECYETVEQVVDFVSNGTEEASHAGS